MPSELKPIDLTLNLLVNNGFKLMDSGKGCTRFGIFSEDTNPKETPWNASIAWFDDEDTCDSFSTMCIKNGEPFSLATRAPKYVHELQHLLRDGGLKDIGNGFQVS